MTNIMHGSCCALIFEYFKAMFCLASCGLVTTTVYSSFLRNGYVTAVLAYCLSTECIIVCNQNKRLLLLLCTAFMVS